ncbi:lipopolysaccharide/colanic/teichoic acid biosynthesis glycosyltransferase [Lactobacillus colini]|uniref:Lipopolysaccharide/colanic/teichoic acid biosynthesis glycosyltransferase n=1 Tax=Lactobacillus colini TaxID=1819254 RepID=A0ABS4MEJ7_9LACO|nr:lipopolysaccharide/colanic/teichoic acid biosynthesis glycosyltransferase [Lactobacillus colini]
MSTNRPIYHFSKRVFDIITSSLALVGLSPVFLVIAILIKRQDGGSPFYAQTRVGKNGKLFKIYKFRSMISNADKVLKQNPDLYRKYVDNGFKLPAEEDPRITKLGRFLRKTSLDEMPQFYNVLKGEMSMVGPRPIIQDELAEYGNRVDKLLSVKPGAFGLWQASGRSNVTYPERCDVELEYVDNASAMYDLKIFFKTIISIIKKDGAF